MCGSPARPSSRRQPNMVCRTLVSVDRTRGSTALRRPRHVPDQSLPCMHSRYARWYAGSPCPAAAIPLRDGSLAVVPTSLGSEVDRPRGEDVVACELAPAFASEPDSAALGNCPAGRRRAGLCCEPGAIWADSLEAPHVSLANRLHASKAGWSDVAAPANAATPKHTTLTPTMIAKSTLAST